MIIGAQYADPDNNNNAGSSYVIFGSDRVFSNPFNLASVNGQNGFIINGVSANDKSGSSVSSAGDVNGDGIDDLIIGEHFPNFSGLTGSNYVVFGSNSPFPNPLNLATLNGLNGFTINGVAAIDWSNSSVSSAGDINNDGIDDLIIGDSSHFLNIAGSSYVVFGNDVIFNNDFGL